MVGGFLKNQKRTYSCKDRTGISFIDRLSKITPSPPGLPIHDLSEKCCLHSQLCKQAPCSQARVLSEGHLLWNCLCLADKVIHIGNTG